MRRIALKSLELAAVFLAYAAIAGGATIEGKAVGWLPDNTGGRRAGVVWLVGGANPPAPRANAVMAQRGGQFVPPFLIVVAGQTVEMPNQDEVAHNVYSFSDAKTFNLGFYAKGERKSVVFEREGAVEVACSLHNFMRATIIVVPNLRYSAIGVNGGYRITGVAAGRYLLKFWGAGVAPLSEEVIVPESGDLRFDFHAVMLSNPTER
jgi:plastocyanin